MGELRLIFRSTSSNWRRRTNRNGRLRRKQRKKQKRLNVLRKLFRPRLHPCLPPISGIGPLQSHHRSQLLSPPRQLLCPPNRSNPRFFPIQLRFRRNLSLNPLPLRSPSLPLLRLQLLNRRLPFLLLLLPLPQLPLPLMLFSSPLLRLQRNPDRRLDLPQFQSFVSS